ARGAGGAPVAVRLSPPYAEGPRGGAARDCKIGQMRLLHALDVRTLRTLVPHAGICRQRESKVSSRLRCPPAGALPPVHRRAARSRRRDRQPLYIARILRAASPGFFFWPLPAAPSARCGRSSRSGSVLAVALSLAVLSLPTTLPRCRFTLVPCVPRHPGSKRTSGRPPPAARDSGHSDARAARPSTAGFLPPSISSDSSVSSCASPFPSRRCAQVTTAK